MQQLTGQYQAVISALRSKLGSRAAPPLLHLDPVFFQEGSPSNLPSPTEAPVKSDPSQESREPWSLLTAWMGEIQKLRIKDETEAEDASKSETRSRRDASPGEEGNAASEDFSFVENVDYVEIKSPALKFPDQTNSIVQQVIDSLHTEMSHLRHAVEPSGLHRKHRSLLNKRQIPGSNGKSMYTLL